MSLYDTLGVAADASDAAIKAAHRRAAKEHHPDKPGGDRAKFDEIQAAYEVLKDPKRRARYDETGETDLNDPEAMAAREAAKFVSELIQSAVDHIEDVVFTDIIEACRKQIADRQEQLDLSHEDALKAEERAKKMLARLTLEDGAEDDPIRAALTMKQEKIRRIAKQIEGAGDILRRATKTLSSYSYRTDPKPPRNFNQAQALTPEQFDSIFGRFGGIKP